MARIKKTHTFLWDGTDKQKKPLCGEIISTDPILAKAELRYQGITPTKIRKKTVPLLSRLCRDNITSMDIAVFTRQLSTLLSAGIPMVQSLDSLSQGTCPIKLSTLITTLKTDIESGCSFSDALEKHPDYFNPLYCHLSRAGEQSGTLDKILSHTATYQEKIESIKAKIKKALYYPMAVITMAFLITGGLLIFVIPQFEHIFQEFDAQLPAATGMVIALSKLCKTYGIVIFIGIGITIRLIMTAHLRSEKMALAVSRILLKLPILGPILQKAAIARFARTLSITFAAGLPLVDALGSVSGATGNALYAHATLALRDDVATGQSIQQSMAQSKLFPAMITQMIGIGEQSGSLELMLTKVADFFEEDVDNAVNSLSSLLEPVIMVILGIIIGGLVIAMYLPIFRLGSIV